MKLLSMRICEHDANFTYFNGETVEYCKSERYHQIKHVCFGLDQWETELKRIWNITPEDLDEIAVIFDPWYHGYERKVETFFPAMEKYTKVSNKGNFTRVNHHYAHALSYWPLLKDTPDVSFIIDGYGDLDKAWTVIKDNKIIEEGSTKTHGSLGMAMGQVAEAMGIHASSEYDLAGKLMGLQSYGKVKNEFRKKLQDFSIYEIKEIFNFENWVKFKGDKFVAELTSLDWITTIHDYIGDLLVTFFQKYAKKEDLIFYAGGVAQNVIWNTKLKKHFPNLVIPPHSADEGLSLGGIEYLRIKHGLDKFSFKNFPFSQLDEAPVQEPDDDLIKKVATKLAEGKIVGWYQGNGEIGPRALGNRSVLFNPTTLNGKDIINNIKRRENYRPFGASVLYEHLEECFWDTGFENPYMLYVYNVKNSKEHKINLDSITHADNTCRVQTVKEENGIFKKLLEEFYKITGCPVLLNTSLNVNGKPIAGSILDAKILFTQTELDVLVIGNLYTEK